MTPMTAPIYSPQDDNTGWWTKVEEGRGDPDKSKTKTTPMAAPPLRMMASILSQTVTLVGGGVLNKGWTDKDKTNKSNLF